MNGEVCCLLGVCCPPLQQEDAIVRELLKEDVVSEAEAKKVAKWIMQHFDLARKGTLDPFKADIAAMARHKR